MKLYKIYYPVMESYVRLKTLTPEQADEFIEQYQNLPKMEYILLVLETCVYNLKTDVLAVIRKLPQKVADEMLTVNLYNGCIMLNPSLDLDTWMLLTQSYNIFKEEDEHIDRIMKSPLPAVTKPSSTSSTAAKTKKQFSISPAKFINLQRHLNDSVIGQHEAVAQVASALKRAQANLNDPDRPVGVFLFCGPSGVGKTLIAKELQKYLFDTGDLIRIDCGEYQHKHENQKLIGSPNGFVGFEEGGQLTKAIAKNPNTVLLIDEAEKAHPDFWNTFLKVFDDGFLTDNKGNNVSFKNTIVIITSNLGNDKVSDISYSKGAGFNASTSASYKRKDAPKRAIVERETEEALHRFFKPEFLNRLDDVIIFNHLSGEDYMKIAELEMHTLANKLSKQHYDLSWDDESLELLSNLSGVSIEGARGMSRVRRERLENPLADLLLNTKHPKGTIFNITVQNENFVIS